MDWTIQELGAAGEFVGAIAVVATLAYLAIQVRHSSMNMAENTRQMKVMALSQHDQSLGTWRANLYTNPEVAQLWTTGARRDAELDDATQFQYVNLVVDFLQRSRTSYAIAKSAGHEGQMQMTVINVALMMSDSAGVRRVWQNAGRRFSEMIDPGFVAAVDRFVAELEEGQGSFATPGEMMAESSPEEIKTH